MTSGSKFSKSFILNAEYTLRVPNFRPFRSISYRFRDNGYFLFRRSRDLGKKFSKFFATYAEVYPMGTKFSSVSLYLLPFLEIMATSCFGGHMTSEKNFENPSHTYAKYTLRVPNFRPFRSISYRFRDKGYFLFRRSHDLGKNFQNPSHTSYAEVCPTGTKFSSVSLYLLPFSRYNGYLNFS